MNMTPEMSRVKEWLAKLSVQPSVAPVPISLPTVTPMTPPQDPDAKALYDHVMTLSKVRNDS